MFKSTKVLAVAPEAPESLIAEKYEAPGEQERREWYAASGDWAFAVLQLLQGSRRNEVSLSELWELETYKRSDQREQDALRFVANQSTRRYPMEENDHVILKTMDDFLIQFSEGNTLGHRDWVAQIRNIPVRVAECQRIDRELFRHQNQFVDRQLFRWLWGAKHGSTL